MRLKPIRASLKAFFDDFHKEGKGRVGSSGSKLLVSLRFYQTDTAISHIICGPSLERRTRILSVPSFMRGAHQLICKQNVLAHY
jgi:hypothetical protein